MKKCLVLDLDNTLWGGIVGEDDISGIQVTAPFIAFQQAILDLMGRGIILSINSKNNFEDAIKVFREHPNMILREPHFAAMRINWADKVDNMRELAQELNIGLDSMVFLDDDPINREMVQAVFPEVEAPELPKNFDEYAKFLLALDYFPKEATTDEDRMRATFYTTELLRKRAEQKFSSREDFLRNLDICIDVCVNDTSCVPRLAQLTEKTNQFNTNKQPMTEAAVLRYITDPNHLVFHVSARDKFGDHGVIGLALVKIEHDEWFIESLLMSCRILGKGIEESFLGAIAEKAKATGVKSIRLIFKQTEKNKPAKDFINQYFKDFKLSLISSYNHPSWVALKWIN